jgi:DNA-binding CsgD family transcriptional regulator
LRANIAALARRARIELDDAAASAAQDEFGLTAREREVLALLPDRRTNQDIADQLYISKKTASVHVSNILRKLGVANRGEAAALDYRRGITSPVGTATPDP